MTTDHDIFYLRRYIFTKHAAWPGTLMRYSRAQFAGCISGFEVVLVDNLPFPYYLFGGNAMRQTSTLPTFRLLSPSESYN